MELKCDCLSIHWNQLMCVRFCWPKEAWSLELIPVDKHQVYSGYVRLVPLNTHWYCKWLGCCRWYSSRHSHYGSAEGLGFFNSMMVCVSGTHALSYQLALEARHQEQTWNMWGRQYASFSGWQDTWFGEWTKLRITVNFVPGSCQKYILSLCKRW